MARIVMRSNNDIKIRPLFNIGALFDIPTSSITIGKHGESIINGGLGPVTAIVGSGNVFKSTTLHFMMLSAINKIEASIPDSSSLNTYDTENNMLFNLDRINNFSKVHECLPDDLVESNLWSITNKAEYPADKWVKEILYPFLKKIESEKEVEFTPFKRLDKSTLKSKIPNFIEIDSLTEFEPEMTMDILESKGANDSHTVFIAQGAFKTKMLKDIPTISNKYNIYFGLTAHLGKKKEIGGNPFIKPSKDLQHLNQDDKVKGSTDKLLFLSTQLYKAYSPIVLQNSSTKEPEFPRTENDDPNDLNLIRLKMIRNKTGASGFINEIIVSQSEGILPTLTEFYYIKQNKYGLEGNNRFYNLIIYKDKKLSRTTIRNLIDEDYKLKRAINITSELLQVSIYKKDIKSMVCSIEELYEDIKEKGYDWDIILRTRGWWSIDNYTPKLRPFLSIVDLLKMRLGLYHPFWMDKDKRVKKEWEWILKEED